MASITGINGLPKDYVPVTPNDSTDNVPSGVIGLYVVTGGDVVVTTSGGDNRTITVADNAFLPLVGLTRVRSTSTTASGISAMVG